MTASPFTRFCDLNCDIGEGIIDQPTERALLNIITSANIACGGHAGDRTSMLRTAAACDELGVAMGIHPSYPDRANFGRQPTDLSPQVLEDSIAEQLIEMERNAYRSPLRHLKPHGALYHAAMTNPSVAETIARAAKRIKHKLIFVGQAGAPALNVWRSMNLPVASEAFADRLYEPSGNLRSREHADALLTSPARAAEQALRIATGQGVITSDGSVIPLAADTICIHSDTPNALAIAQAVRDALESRGIKLRALS